MATTTTTTTPLVPSPTAPSPIADVLDSFRLSGVRGESTPNQEGVPGAEIPAAEAALSDSGEVLGMSWAGCIEA